MNNKKRSFLSNYICKDIQKRFTRGAVLYLIVAKDFWE